MPKNTPVAGDHIGRAKEIVDFKRRGLVVAAASLACTPLAVQSQAPARLQRIGWLDLSSAAENIGIFTQALTARGWQDGRTFRIEYRGGEGKVERLTAVAAELARLPTDVVVAPGTSEAIAAHNATKSIPIVMTEVDDPVERGLVASLARPGGNVTGLANARRELVAKLLSLTRELMPGTPAVAALSDATTPEHQAIIADLQAAARTLGMTVNAVAVQRYTEVEPAIAAIRKRGNRALFVPASSMLVPAWIAELALKNQLALASTAASYVYEGGLVSYTNDRETVFDRAATFVDRILKGAKPSDLPVELPTKFKLIVNTRTAQALNIAIPSAFRVRADHVIE